MVDQFSIGRPRFGVDNLATRYDGGSRGARPRGGFASRYRRAPIGGLSKRIFDIVGASVALVLIAPLMLAVALLVRFVLGKRVIFPQRRVGFDGETFVCYKF